MGVEQVVTVIARAKLDESPFGRRVHACLWLSLDMNLTLEAMRTLNVGDLDIQNMRIGVTHGYTGDYRWREMAEVTVSALARWFDARKEWECKPSAPLFIGVVPTCDHGRLSTTQIGLDLTNAFSRAGQKGGIGLSSVSRAEILSCPIREWLPK
jgi:site-specific recombinase XerC